VVVDRDRRLELFVGIGGNAGDRRGLAIFAHIRELQDDLLPLRDRRLPVLKAESRVVDQPIVGEFAVAQHRRESALHLRVAGFGLFDDAFDGPLIEVGPDQCGRVRPAPA